MIRYIKTSHAQQLAADAAAVLSTSAAGWTWLSHVNDILQFIATIIAIVSGVYALRYHAKKHVDKENKDDSGPNPT